MAIKPPGRQTRSSSEATTSGRGANMAPNIDSYNIESGGFIRELLGVALDEFDFQFFAAARWRACSRRLVAMSRPMTSAPARAAGMD